MATNIKQVTQAHQGVFFPLRGDMGIALDFIPTDGFDVGFVTHTDEEFTLTSSVSQIRQQDGTLASELVVGGHVMLSFMLIYNAEDNIWEITLNNVAVQSSNDNGATGAGNRPEMLLEPDETNTITPDGLISNRFRFVMRSDTKIGDPINYTSAEHLYFTGHQDEVGNRKLEFARSMLLLDALPYTPPAVPKAIFVMEMRPTVNVDDGSLNWTVNGSPDKASRGFAMITELVQIGDKTYYTVASAFGPAYNNLQNGETAIILRNGRAAEATGTLVGTAGAVYYIYGVPVPANGADQRPVLELLQTDFSSGGANRPAFGKALLNLEGSGTTYVRDLKVTGARNDSSDARGICHNDSGMKLVTNNVEIANCNNGILTGNAATCGDTEMYDSMITKCGIGGPAPDDPAHGYTTVGFTHSVYFGHNPSTVRMARVSLLDAVQGNNLKCRSARLYATQIVCTGASLGRELELPNGGWAEIDNSIFWKKNQEGTGNLAMVGGNGQGVNMGEGLDTTRPRKYKFTNVLFRSDYVLNGRDGMLVCNLDHEVPLEFIDCDFQGPAVTNNSNDPNEQPLYAGTTTVNGIRYKPSAPPVYTYTGGPIGPVLTPGATVLPMTPIN